MASCIHSIPIPASITASKGLLPWACDRWMLLHQSQHPPGLQVVQMHDSSLSSHATATPDCAVNSPTHSAALQPDWPWGIHLRRDTEHQTQNTGCRTPALVPVQHRDKSKEGLPSLRAMQGRIQEVHLDPRAVWMEVGATRENNTTRHMYLCIFLKKNKNKTQQETLSHL